MENIFTACLQNSMCSRAYGSPVDFPNLFQEGLAGFIRLYGEQQQKGIELLMTGNNNSTVFSEKEIDDIRVSVLLLLDHIRTQPLLTLNETNSELNPTLKAGLILCGIFLVICLFLLMTLCVIYPTVYSKIKEFKGNLQQNTSSVSYYGHHGYVAGEKKD